MYVNEIEGPFNRQRTKAHVRNEPRVNQPVEQNFIHDPAGCADRSDMEGAGIDILHPRRGVLQKRTHVHVLTAVAGGPDQKNSQSRGASPARRDRIQSGTNRRQTATRRATAMY